MEKKRRIKKVEREFLFSLGLKYCSKCREIKRLLEFSLCRPNKDGYQFTCTKCIKKYQETDTFKKHQKKYQKQYLKTDSGKIAKKKYFTSNKGKIARKTSQENYRKSDIGKIKRNIRNRTNICWGSASGFPCADCRQPAKEWHHFSYEDDWRHHAIPVCNDCHDKITFSVYE